jgi:2,4-dienoyl-CoA reductase-like NADH-dependent reductase (Old Yellow Enzyme family)/thioredoxin reductase
MPHKFKELLAPIRVRNLILKNRMMSSASTPHFLQGVEAYPTEKIISHFANRAKSGAAAVAINHFHQDKFPFFGRSIDNPPGHFNLYDLNNDSAQNYLCQLVDAIHFYGAKATGYLMADPGWFFPDGKIPEDAPPPMMPDFTLKRPMSSEIDSGKSAESDGPPLMDISNVTREMMGNYIKNAAREARELRKLGFDIISMHSCYRHSPHACFLSPLTNHRTDEYGKNRSRFILEIFTALREAVGDAPLEIVYSVSEPEGGYTVSDTVEFAKLADGLIDILHLRSGEMDPQHPLGYTSSEEKPMPYIDEMAHVARAAREAGLKILVGASAGFHDIKLANDALKEGKADLIYMARSWISNPDYGRLVYEEREDELRPCIRCNKCHVPNGGDKWRSVCSVNPMLGFEDKLERMTSPAASSKKVAVIGGGPAGLEFAATAAQRGHRVTLFEASDRLGGQLKHADYPSFKWPLRRLKDHLIERLGRLGVEVKLNAKATPEMIRHGYFDAAAVAIGSRPAVAPIPGIERDNVHFASQIYGGMEQRLSDRIVVIGGGEIGVETALYLCELGKKATVLEMLPELISDLPHAHYKNMVRDYWRRQPNFSYKCGVRCISIDEGGVNYIDYEGKEGKAIGDDILLAVGDGPLIEEAMEFADCADEVLFIGACDSPANVQKSIRSGFSRASCI